MVNKLTFVTGLAVGYVLGAKAGTERYEAIRKTTSKLMGNPQVQQAGHAAAEMGREAGAKATQRLGEHLPDRFGRHLPNRFGQFTPSGSTAQRYGDGL